jgi:hypothetical protein
VHLLDALIASTCLAVLFVPSFFRLLQEVEEWRKTRKKAPGVAPDQPNSWARSHTRREPAAMPNRSACARRRHLPVPQGKHVEVPGAVIDIETGI